MDRLDEPRPDDAFRVLWAMNGMRTLFDAEAAAGLRETYEFCIGDEHFHVRIDDGRVEVLDGPADDAVLRICSDADTFLAALSSTRAPDRSGLVVEGDRGALERCRRVFAPTVPALARRSSG